MGRSKQGTFTSMRVRSGFVPNVLSLSLRRQINDNTKLEMTASIWATIETESMRKTSAPITLTCKKAMVASPGLGAPSLPVGRSICSRAAPPRTTSCTAHGYGLGFAGNIDNYGPANGMIGFGVIARVFCARYRVHHAPRSAA